MKQYSPAGSGKITYALLYIPNLDLNYSNWDTNQKASHLRVVKNFPNNCLSFTMFNMMTFYLYEPFAVIHKKDISNTYLTIYNKLVDFSSPLNLNTMYWKAVDTHFFLNYIKMKIYENCQVNQFVCHKTCLMVKMH